jgi:CRISPR-associated protein Csm1
MAYAMGWLAEWSGHGRDALPAGLPANAGEWLAAHRRLLGTSWAAPEPGTPLLSIFSRVKQEGAPDPRQVYWPAGALSVEKPAYPQEGGQARPDAGLWPAFRAEWEQIRGWEGDVQFEAFTHLLHKYAWAVPCSYGEPGVSLYDEFRALSALVHASGCGQEPAKSFSLVGGDIPGIQRTIYTISSKGAAKGLRGRSAFIQLLGDAVVRRVLQELGLPETNVVYAAGGNFMLLAQAGVADRIGQLAQAINERLLKAFEGDLALCLACVDLPAGDVGSGRFATGASADLGAAIGQDKGRRFAGLAERQWAQVFGPQGEGGPPFCAVCQHEQQPREQGQRLEEGGWKCEQCAAFEELAQDIARERLLMFVSSEPWAGRVKGWQRLLADLTGWWYDFQEELKPDTPPGTRVYSVNYPDFLGEYAHGFRLIANTTPREDNGQVRTFEGLADGAAGLKRVGVLRMDVDDLGQVLTRWLPERTMASTSALSHALDRFFAGWLDAICREAMAEPPMKRAEAGRQELLYVIYAGGDDLFVVGAWDLMPLLADLIRGRFAAYVGGNPALHISAGISVEDRKFPLYQAAVRAGDALDHGAKELTRLRDGREVKKDAVSFLGRAVGWERYPFLRQLAEKLTELTQEQGVPRSLLTTMRAIHDRYYEDVDRARKRGLDDERVHYGPWMWRQVYQLARTRQRYDGDETQQIAASIKELETTMLTYDNMPYVGLATRWAEYLTRGGDI